MRKNYPWSSGSRATEINSLGTMCQLCEEESIKHMTFCATEKGQLKKNEIYLQFLISVQNRSYSKFDIVVIEHFTIRKTAHIAKTH